MGTVVVLVSGCGTTVPLAQQRAATGDGFDGALGAPIGVGQPVAPHSSGGQGGALAATPNAAGTVPVANPGVASMPTVSAVPAGKLASGVTATTVRIGYMYWPSAPLAVLGSTQGDQSFIPAFYKALGDDTNKNGGVLGHQVVTDGYAVPVSTDKAQTEQAPCEHFTQEKPALAVLWSYYGDILTSCLNSKGVAHVGGIYGAPAYVDSSLLRRHAFYVPAAVVADDYLRVFVSRLKALGYFSGWDTTTGRPGSAPVKIGLLNLTDPAVAPIGARLKQELARAGYAVDPANEFDYAGSLDSQTSTVPSAILRFRANGVTHVLGTGAGGLLLDGLKSQSYFPRLGWDSNAGFYGVSTTNTDSASKNMLRGVVGVGFIPAKDVATWTSVSPLQTRCEGLATAAGIQWRDNQDKHLNVLHACENYWSLIAALRKGGSLTPAGIDKGFSTLGTVQSVLSFSETWGPDRHASVSVVADIRYDESCTCFRYTGTRTRF
jgi:hypothetical protein